MLVLGKHMTPGSAAAYGADQQDAGFADSAKTLPPPTRLSRPHRGAAEVLVAGPTPPRTGDTHGTDNTRHRHAQPANDNTLSATLSGDRLTVTCSCGCYSLAAHKPAEPHDGLVRCLICGARAGLADLLTGTQARRGQHSDTERS
jgi:hypothetical protein